MNNYSIDIFLKGRVEFSAGNVYLVKLKTEIDRKEFLYSRDAVYLNYPFSEAVKIIPFYEHLKAAEQKRIAKFLQDCFGFSVRVDDLFGKMLITLLHNIELHNVVIVGLAGLSNNSINMLIGLSKKIVSKEKSKIIIITDPTSNLRESIAITKL